jgi:hypothetical protein
MVLMAERHKARFGRSSATVTLFALAMAAPGCSSQEHSLPELGTAEDYVAERQNGTYACSYGSYELCTVTWRIARRRRLTPSLMRESSMKSAHFQWLARYDKYRRAAQYRLIPLVW